MDRTFTNSSGMVVKCKPVSETLLALALSKIEADFRERGEPLDPPTYTVKIVLPTGEAGEEVHAHDEKSLEVPDNEAATAANKQAWAAHQAARAKLEKAQNDRREYLWFMAGVEAQLPADDAWAKEQEALFGITVPVEPLERKLHYIKTVLLVSLDDIMRALEIITQLSYAGLVKPEAVHASIESFRNSIPGAPAAGDQDAGGAVAA